MIGYLGSIDLGGRNNKSVGLWSNFKELYFLNIIVLPYGTCVIHFISRLSAIFLGKWYN